MKINACRRCGSTDVSKLPGGELGRESFHCKSCGAMGEPRTFITEDEHNRFLKAIELAKNPPSHVGQARDSGGFIQKNYKKIIIAGILTLFLIFIAICVIVVYLLLNYVLAPTANATIAQVVGEDTSCEPPFVRIGSSCCIDENKNRVCDIDDAVIVETTAPSTIPSTTLESPTTPSTTLKESTTSVSTTIEQETTIAEPTSTLEIVESTIVIACYKDSDCGTEKVKYVCDLDDIYEITEKPFCRNPGKPQAMCMIKQGVMTPVLRCKDPKKCVEGEKRCA